MIKKNIIKKLVLWLAAAGIISTAVLWLLMSYNQRLSAKSAAELGTVYMSEMMVQMQEHLSSVLELKSSEVNHISDAVPPGDDKDYRQAMRQHAQDMGFEYLALYDDNGNYEVICGEDAWYRDWDSFVKRVKAGESPVTTGYLTGMGDKYVVFGTPVQYEMEHGRTSTVLLAGFSVERIYEYINLEKLQYLGSNATMEIVASNGSYVLKNTKEDVTSFYDYITSFGDYTYQDAKEQVETIEKAMSAKDVFSAIVTLDGEMQHVYGTPAREPGDWYFVLFMPQGVTDDILGSYNRSLVKMFSISGVVILMVIMAVFYLYTKLSIRQLKEIESAKLEAETANRAKSMFLSNMSHDIRTPMNAVVGFTEMAEQAVLDENKDVALESLKKMRRSSDYLRSLISDVLDMSKIESGTLNLIPEIMSVKENTELISSIAEAQARQKNHKFQLNIHDIIHEWVLCDQTRLKQVMINLLGNAVKFTPNGGCIGFEVWQEASERGPEYICTHFVVSDNGIGMSEEFCSRMFENFSREEHKVRKIEGTGLGLSISKCLVEMMEGDIYAKTKEGKGSKFYVDIDFLKQEPPATEARDEKQLADMKGMRILLAEDNEFNYDIAQSLLSTHSFEVEWARDGQEAVELYCANPHKWNVILMDLRMPVLNGYQATEEIRRFEKQEGTNLHVPIFALSADVFEEDIRHCYEVGMEEHISKPIDMQELFHVLEKYLSKQQAEKE